jgi:hypothetical protein
MIKLMNKKILLAVLVFIAAVLAGNFALAAGSGFYVDNGNGTVYDISGGQFRQVSYAEAMKDNIWSQINKFNPNSIPLYDKAGNGHITAVMFGREPWIQTDTLFNAIFGSGAWSRIIKPTPLPTVNISVSPTSITAGQTVTISWSSTNATGCTGSLGSSYGISGSFTDNPFSTKTYGMKCTGAGGTSGFSYATVNVSAVANKSPSAGITMTSGGTTAYENQVMNLSGSPASVTFNASRSNDPDGSISSYTWSINGTQVSTSNSFNFSLAAGTHQIFLTVKDNKGAAGSVGASIIITAAANKIPVAKFTMTSGGSSANENGTLNVSGSPASVSFNSTSSDPDGSINSNTWKINGTLVSVASSFTYSLATGTHDILLTVVDNKGASVGVGAKVVVTAAAGNFVRSSAGPDIFDISSGQFRYVTAAEASKWTSAQWSSVVVFDPNTIPLIRIAGEYRVDAVISGKKIWIQDPSGVLAGQEVFSKLGFKWDKVTTDLKGSYKPASKTVGDTISLWWETLNLLGSATITCKNMTLDSVCVGWSDKQVVSSGNGTNNKGSAIIYTPKVGGTYVFNISSNPSASVSVVVAGFQCSDGVDNDGDSLTDALDPGCSNPLDNDETDGGPIIPLPACSDGIDNDGDGLIDMSDPGCSGPADNDETNGVVPPTLFVTLSASPTSGNAPLTSTLTANVSGTASGLITYQFDCGNGAPLGSFNNVSDNPKTFSCTYANAGTTYTALVRADRGGAPQTQATADVTTAAALPPAIVIFGPIIPSVPIINVFEPFIGVVVNPVCTINASPKALTKPPYKTTLSWSCDQPVNGCNITDTNPKVNVGGVTSPDSITLTLDSPTTFTFGCAKSNSSSVTVGVSKPSVIEVNPKPL